MTTIAFPSTMSNTGDDSQGQRADGDGVLDTRAILTELHGLAELYSWADPYRTRLLRNARAIIALVAPALCSCGAINTHWLHDDHRAPCAGCGRHPYEIAVAGNHAEPHGDGEAPAVASPSAGAVTEPAPCPPGAHLGERGGD